MHSPCFSGASRQREKRGGPTGHRCSATAPFPPVEDIPTISENLTQTTERFLALDLDTQRAALAQFLHLQLLRLQRLTGKTAPDTIGHWGSVLDDVPLLIHSGTAEEIRKFVTGLPSFYSPLGGGTLAVELHEAINLAEQELS